MKCNKMVAVGLAVLWHVAVNGMTFGQSTPTLGTADELRRQHPETKYVLTIRVDSPGFDYSSAAGWVKSVGKSRQKGGRNVVGHTWVELSDGISLTTGGHSGECSENPNAPVRDGRIRAPFFTYNEGIIALSEMNPNAASPLPDLRNSKNRIAADPANPAAWLFFSFEDGHWATGSAGHKDVTHEASFQVSEAEYAAGLKYIKNVTANDGAKLRSFSLAGYQCTATAAAIAKEANIDLDPYVRVEIPEKVVVEGRTIRLRTNPVYSEIRFAAPEAMARAIMESANLKKGGRLVVARKK